MKTAKRIWIVVFILFNHYYTYSQNSSDSIASNNVGDENYSSIMLNVSYTNNNLEYLSGTTEKIPTLFANGTYTHKWGLYVGGSYAAYLSDTIASSEYELTAGYQKYFDNGFDLDLSYNWHQYDGDTLLEGLNYQHALGLMVGQELGKFYISGDASYAIGNTNNLFAELSFSRFFQINNIFSKHDVLLINPGISVSFGTDYWLYENMTIAEKQSTSVSLTNAGYTPETFSYEGFNIFVPVSYGIKSVYLSASYLYRIPGSKYEFLGWENQSGFMFSLTYFLNFNK
ncbi:MAG: hypothetical protein AB7S50_14575 [Bacteroidales bacterium]